VSNEIQYIIQVFIKQIYGGSQIPTTELTLAQTAWRALRSPRHWKMRMTKAMLGYS
jgi:hypothetical protein